MTEADSTPSSLSWPPEDRDRLDRELAGFLDESRRAFALSSHLSPLFDQLTAFVLDGGKRLRPRLCLASMRILGASHSPELPDSSWKVAASLELFHAFMLVHDDLIDGSTTRRDRPTLHEALRGPGRDDRAEALGLIGGDLLFAMGMRMLGNAGLEPETWMRAHRLLSDMLLETGLGEALDVLSDDRGLDQLDESQILEAYCRKTARYTFSGPLVLGATLAGAPETVGSLLHEYGTRLGLAYQVRNDLDALDGDPESTEQPDLDGGKRTLVLWKAYQRSGPGDREALVEALGLPPGPSKRRRLLDRIEASGAIGSCLGLIARLRSEAMAVLKRSDLDAPQRQAFLAMADLVRPVPATAAHAANSWVGCP